MNTFFAECSKISFFREWSKSYHKEIVTNGWGFECSDYISFLANNMKFIEYEKVIDNYSIVFGRESIDLIVYGNKLKQVGIDKVFNNYLGIDLNIKTKEKLTNMSSSDEFSQVCLNFNRKVLPIQAARDVINKYRNESSLAIDCIDKTKLSSLNLGSFLNTDAKSLNKYNVIFGSVNDLSSYLVDHEVRFIEEGNVELQRLLNSMIYDYKKKYKI